MTEINSTPVHSHYTITMLSLKVFARQRSTEQICWIDIFYEGQNDDNTTNMRCKNVVLILALSNK